jgi:hypothetical protein
MTEIPFLSALGDALDAAIAEQPAPMARSRRPRLSRRAWRLVPLIALLAVGAAAAQSLLGGSTQLAARSISCMSATNNDGNGAYDIATLGRTPQQACSAVEHRPAADLVACDAGRFGIVVYYASGNPGQCARLGYRPVPASYAAADTHVHQLVVALGRLYHSRDCFAPAALVSAVDRTLTRLGFTGWHAAFEPRLSSGPCGAYPATGASMSSAAAAIDANGYPAGAHDLVMIVGAPSRSLEAVTTRAQLALLSASGRRCYSVSALETLAERLLAAARLPVLFAVAAEQPHTQAGLGRQPRYDRGCAIAVTAGPSSGERSIDVLLWQRQGRTLPQSGIVPAGDYRPAG